MKKKVVIAIFLLIMIISTNVFASANVKMEIVEDNICTIKLNEESEFEKKIISSDLENHEVTLQLKISNNAKKIIPEGELILVIDSSSSMNEIAEGETTRKDLVLKSANTLVEGLLAANPTSLEIGIVTFSSNSEKNEQGFLDVGTAIDAQKVCDFTNNVESLKDKISKIEGTGQYTNLDAGLQLANSQFTEKETNKYMIILTDGVPNLAVGKNELFSAEGIAQTKTTLASMSKVEIITMLTGIEDEDAYPIGNEYTYGQIIEEVFGTEETPTNGMFYNIQDSEIEETITNKIYRELLPVEKTLENITIIDYIPQYIVDNFDVSINEESSNLSVTISEDNKTITWKVDKLRPEETKNLKFDLKLKEKFNEKIIGEILDTNEKVDITFDDFDGTNKSDSSDVTPKIKLTDITVAPEIIPEAGSPLMVWVGILILGCVAILFGYKSRKI